jgi:6,7-dimethyl-8-ribityllumazine synthase
MKWAAVTTRAKSEEDFALLTKMLEALGFHAYEAEDYKNVRLQMFRPNSSILEVAYGKTPRSYPDLEITLSDPDSAVEVIRRMGLEIAGDSSGPEPRHTVRHFDVCLPGGTSIRFTGIRNAGGEPNIHGALEGNLLAAGKTFAIVVSRFNSFITERLLAGAVDGLCRSGIDSADRYQITRVPGAFEIPLAARKLAETKKYDAIICLGCLLRGDTAHYDVIVNEVTRGIGQSAQETGVPHAFGVLTCENLEQAIDRAGLKMGNKGFEAALAAVEMASLTSEIENPASVVGKKRVPRSARNEKPKKLRNDKPEKIGNRKPKKTVRSNKKRK